MSYDFDDLADHSAPVVSTYVPHHKDLEAIVTVLTLAVLDLTPDPSATFTFEQLFAKVQEWGGPEVPIEERDLRIVLGSSSILKKMPGRRYQMR